MTTLERSLVVAAVVLAVSGAGGRAFEAEAATQTAKPAAAASAERLDAEGLLAKLKAMDALYESGFTASGRYSNMKWKLTMGDGKIAWEEELLKVPKPPAPRKRAGGRGGRERGTIAPSGGGGFTTLRKTMFIGPDYYAVYDWVGRRPPAGPLAPWPEGEKGLATAGNLKICALNDPAYLWHILRRVQLIGRGYSRHIDKITGVHHREDGLTSFTADGTMHRSENYVREVKWTCLVDPKAAYMMRYARMNGVRSRVFDETKEASGLKWDGPLCAPENIRGRSRGRVTSFSSRVDKEFLEKVHTTLHGPYLIHTDWHDERGGGNGKYRSIKAGGTWEEK